MVSPVIGAVTMVSHANRVDDAGDLGELPNNGPDGGDHGLCPCLIHANEIQVLNRLV
jgi:hypothetical protein